MSYHPIEPLRCGHKTWPVRQIYLPGMAFSHDKPFEMLHELLSCLFWQELRVDSSGWAESK